MFKVIKAVTSTFLVATLLFACAEDSMAYGRCQARWRSDQHHTSRCPLPAAGQPLASHSLVVNNGLVAASTRVQYQSAFQAPAAQPQSLSSASYVQTRGHHFPVNNSLPKSDPRRYSPN